MSNSDSGDSVKSDFSQIRTLFNYRNIEITKEDIEFILKQNGLIYTVNNINLFKRAFVHKSYTSKYKDRVETPDNCVSLKSKSNERLEFLGDGVLEICTKFYLYSRFNKSSEGHMTIMKIKLVNNEVIGQFAKDIGLAKWLIISEPYEFKQTRNNLKVLGCLFEAFIGALFIDAYTKLNPEIKVNIDNIENITENFEVFNVVYSFIKYIFEHYVDWSTMLQTDDNYKNLLQIKLQQYFRVTPVYIDVKKDCFFKTGVFLIINCDKNSNPNMAIDVCNFKSPNGKINISTIIEYVNSNDGIAFINLGNGEDRIKKKSEMLAAKEALSTITF
jgi:dsRNA-specific ribonuclease